jgi:hypothetical protein
MKMLLAFVPTIPTAPQREKHTFSHCSLTSLTADDEEKLRKVLGQS